MDFDKIVMPDRPLQDFVSSEQQKTTYNVLVQSMLAGSGKKLMDSLAYDLSQTKWGDTDIPMFNVTVLTERESNMQKKVSSTLHLIEWDYKSDDLVQTQGPALLAFARHENSLMDGIVRG